MTQHLSKKGHAATEELARLLHIKSPRLSLYIDEKVNLAARRIIDRDLVVFRESWLDAERGESIQNSWWLTCPFEFITSPGGREP